VSCLTSCTESGACIGLENQLASKMAHEKNTNPRVYWIILLDINFKNDLKQWNTNGLNIIGIPDHLTFYFMVTASKRTVMAMKKEA
jgi:hypothetical protein